MMMLLLMYSVLQYAVCTAYCELVTRTKIIWKK